MDLGLGLRKKTLLIISDMPPRGNHVYWTVPEKMERLI